MIQRHSRRRAIGLLTAAGMAAAACSGPSHKEGRVKQDRHVVIASGATEGVYFRYGAALAGVLRAGLPGTVVQNLSTTGSIDNLHRIAQHSAALAFTAADAAADAYGGHPPFASPVPLRAIATLYDDYLHLVVRADSRIHTVGDLRGARVSLGPPGSGTALLANRLLAAANLSATTMTDLRLGINESIAALRNGQIAAFFWSGGLPTQGVADLARRTPIRLVGLQGLSDVMRARYGSAYRLATVQAGIYPGVSASATIAVPDLLVTTADQDDERVFDMTRLLFAARDSLASVVPEAARLDERSAIYTDPIPLHPGAARFYRTTKP